ncbi:MAG: AAA family ATPase [Planctomycetales bacterium]
MKLARVELENFRCFESLTVPLDPRLNVFVGGNGSGKSTVLHAISVCLAPILARLPLERKEKVPGLAASDIRFLGDDRSAPYVRTSAQATGLGEGAISWERMRLRDESPATKKQAPGGSQGLKVLHAQVDRIVDAHNNQQPVSVPVCAYYGTNRAVDVPHYRLQAKTMPKSFRRLAGLEGALGARADFRRAVGWFDLYEQQELREARDVGGKRPLPALKAVRQAIQCMIPGVENPRIDAQTGRFAVDARDPAGTPIKLFLDQLSDGYQVMLGVVMDFALRMAIANPPLHPDDDLLSRPAILIVDEVDLHLHPSWQQRVIPDLRRTFTQTQLILSTHSPQVATTVPSESLRILKDGRVYAAPAGAEGAEAQRLLEDVFGVEPRPAVAMVQKLNRYMELVEQRRWDSPDAILLRRELDEWSQGQEPRLLEADLRIDNLKWEAAG